MFKKFLHLFIIISTFSCVLRAMNRNIPSVEVGGVTRAGYPEFFASFARPDAVYFSASNSGVFFSGDQPIVDRVPLIGHYQNPDTKKKGQTRGDQYNGRVRVALIEFDKAALSRVISESIRAALAQAKITDLSNVEFYANFLGNFVYVEQAPFGEATNSCNVAFHPVLRRWRGSGYANFNVPVQAGIFEPNGISPRVGGIAFGSLGRLDVHYHDREAFSPDNGRFNIDPSRAMVTFWVVGVHGGNVNVTFTIIANNEVAESLLLGITGQDDFAGVLRVLNRASNALSGQDVEALRNAVGVLQRASGQIGVITPSFVGASRQLGVAASSSVHAAMILSQEDQENLDDMVIACEQLALAGNIESARSLLPTILVLDPERARLCEFMLAS